MKVTQLVTLISALVVYGVCASNVGLSYTDSLVGGLKGVSGPVVSDKSLVSNALSGICHLDCPLGTQCSLEFGTPRCVRVRVAGAGLGSYLGNNIGLDLHTKPIALEPSFLKGIGKFGFGRCASFIPACHATLFDRFEQCRFTFDLRLRRCVRVYVRNVCAIFDGPHHNIFSSRFDCEHSCGRRITY